MMDIGMDTVRQHEAVLTRHLLELGSVPGVRILGPAEARDRIATVAFESRACTLMTSGSSLMRRA